jgi:NTP pyrophosphatase (non-canonical NTP hydrolase)
VGKEQPQAHLLTQLRDQCMRDSHNWFPGVMGKDKIEDLKHHVLSLCGESGELANLVKKVDRGSLDFDAEVTQLDLADELTDVLIYVLNVAAILDVDLLQKYIAKRRRNIERFGGKKAS